jgi:hypothetical protein
MTRRVVLAAARASSARDVLASCLAWPVFEAAYRSGAMRSPALLIYQGNVHG